MKLRLAICSAVAGLVLGTAARANAPYQDSLGPIGSLPLALDEAVAGTLAQTLPLADGAWRKTGRVRIALISSGVDSGVLPEALRSRVSLLGNGGDAVGYGTYAASVLLQLAPDAQITSIGIYPNGRFHPDWQAGALDWVAKNTRNLDVVLYALPPTEFLDPISAAMATREWDRIADAIARHGLPGQKGPVYGVSLWGHLRAQQTRGMVPADRAALERFAYLTGRWAQARSLVQKITAAGVGFVAPAGDVGPGLQTIAGLANFPEVTTVGGFDGRMVSAFSALGPSIDGQVKPDLLAPAGIAGALPSASQLARVLAQKELLDPDLQLDWAAPQPLTNARARLDTTLTSAAVVAAAMGTMSASGLRDVARQRGALTAASVPLASVPVWQQGAGVLKFLPDAAFAAARPLALAHASLGAEPDAGAWLARVPFTQAAPSGASVSVSDFAGTGADALPAIRTVLAGADAPPVSAQVSDRGVDVWLPLGDDSYEGGLYCGYTEVSVPATGGTVDPRLSVHGIPDGTEQVPTCLVKGTRLKGFNFYIHDINAENLTMGLLPALPVQHSLLNHAMHLLPIDPLSTKLFFRVSGDVRFDERGRPYNLEFPNIPPGYYTVRQWADYGAPITQTVADASGQPVVQDSDIGENPSYQSFQALVLSAVCRSTAADVAGDPCSEQWLQQQFGEDNVQYDKTTGSYLVTQGPATVRVVFDWVKKMQGTNVASRYIDLLKYSDFNFNVGSLATGLGVRQLQQPATSEFLKIWKFHPGADPSQLVADFNAAAANLSSGQKLGIVRYPFNLTTPNYKAHLSLNFSYAMENAVIIVAVQMGDSVGFGLVTSKGTFRLPSLPVTSPINLPPLELQGRGQGTANFEFHMLPRGAAEGTLWLVFLPPPVAGNLVLPISNVTVGDMSFELDTWTNVLWPPITFDEPQGRVHGHSFNFNSRYSTRQMSDPNCRLINNGRQQAPVCEAWTVMVQSPGDDAATYNLVDVRSGQSIAGELRSGGAAYFDPRRGVVDFSFTLTHALLNLPDVERLFGPFRTNGRFWEQLSLPQGILQAHPGEIQVRIVDNAVGRASPLADHHLGGVQVAPYVPFTSSAVFLDLDL